MVLLGKYVFQNPNPLAAKLASCNLNAVVIRLFFTKKVYIKLHTCMCCKKKKKQASKYMGFFEPPNIMQSQKDRAFLAFLALFILLPAFALLVWLPEVGLEEMDGCEEGRSGSVS